MCGQPGRRFVLASLQPSYETAPETIARLQTGVPPQGQSTLLLCRIDLPPAVCVVGCLAAANDSASIR